MTSMKVLWVTTGFVAAAIALPAMAQTSTRTATFEVRIGIEGSCEVLTPTNIDFGTQVPSAGTHDATGTITVQCTNGQDFTLGLDGGTSAGGSVTSRAMTGPNGATTTTIPYTLSNASAGGANWGDSVGSLVSGTGTGLGTGHDIEFTVYGQATLAGTEPAGDYTDTVTATLTY